MESLKIQIPSIAENIRIVESFIDNVKDTYHLPDDMYGNVMVAITEGVNNAIAHGNGYNSEKNVTIEFYPEGDKQFKFVITDEGNGFNVHDLPDPTAPENLHKIGGRGVYIMRQLADSVLFFGNGQRVELLFKL